jgi:hypothetical protein
MRYEPVATDKKTKTRSFEKNIFTVRTYYQKTVPTYDKTFAYSDDFAM